MESQAATTVTEQIWMSYVWTLFLFLLFCLTFSFLLLLLLLVYIKISGFFGVFFFSQNADTHIV